MLARCRNRSDTDCSRENVRAVGAADDLRAYRRNVRAYVRRSMIVRVSTLPSAMMAGTMIVAAMIVARMIMGIMFCAFLSMRRTLIRSTAIRRSRPCGHDRRNQ